MLAGDVLQLEQDGTVSRRHVGDVAAALRPRRGGGAVIAVERGFVLEDADGSLTALPDLWTGNEVRMNDGGCDPHGRFYCGSMAYDHRPGGGALYRLDPDGSVAVVLDAVTISNGLEWSPDGARAYYADTPTREIAVFEYGEDAELTDRRSFTSVDGLPDGLTVDAEGGVWVALYDRGSVRRYGPDGSLEAQLALPVPRVTACTFGADDLDQLFITTTREGLPPGEHPLAGSVYVADVGVRGLPAREFGSPWGPGQ